MITRFQLRNFKGHRDTTLDLGRFTMLVGDNASGKTSVLEALLLQSAIVHEDPAVLSGAFEPEDLFNRSAMPQGFELDVYRPEFRARIKVAAASGVRWQLSYKGDGGLFFSETASGTDLVSSDDWRPLRDHVGLARLYRLRAESIAAAAYSDRPDASIEADGTNTAVALAALKLDRDEDFARIEDGMRRLIPALERVRLRRATVERKSDSVVGSKISFDFRGAAGIPAHGASHGTLIVLSLLTILYGRQRPELILLDDFDHALHPTAQLDLVRLMKGLLALPEFKTLQIVATTHSPYMLDELDPKDVYAFALRDDGTVASKRLSEHPAAEKMKGSLTPGQLWTLDREREWVLKA